MGTLANLLFEEDQPSKPKGKLFCDMDGVLTDFTGRFDHYFGMDPEEYKEKKGKKAFWSAITPIGQIFWEGMEWTSHGEDLWEHIREFSPTLLTAPSQEQSSRDGKVEWVNRELTPIPPIIFRPAKEKHLECTGPDDILIDDREDTIQRWKDAGGIGIYHPENGDPSEVIQRLKKLGYVRSTEEGI
jgi:hypothetical protein